MSKRSLQDLSFQECVSLIEEETKRGRGFKNDRGKFLCPLHNEKTPSFTLNEGQNGVWFYCFGCQKGVNMLTFYKNFGDFYTKTRNI